ncbi:putative death-receptor fusion protein (DUF2428) [Novymonas esmeraldas]|uniref:Death-receptor fusion protein (DUF2428) n=1 Tax=Novymonas esmeraldas TaxID=1808958 RepID=A0AAW0F8F0_9TRYP
MSAGQAASATLARRRQRRPDLQSTFDVPHDVQESLRHAARVLLASAPSAPSTPASRVVRATDAALHDLLQPALTPEQQLHAISKMTNAVREIPKAELASTLIEPAGELYAWGRTLALEAVVPLLLDHRVRYLHRALMTLLRVALPSPDSAAELAVRGQYETRVLRCLRVRTTRDGQVNGGSGGTFAAAAALYSPTSSTEEQQVGGGPSAERDQVLDFLNAVDGLTSTLMPMMPRIFTDTFLQVLPLLADCFQWVVVNATSRSRARAATATPSPDRAAEDVGRGGGGEADAGAVFGEDLEHIRFCVRVVATYIHKYMDSLTRAISTGSTATAALVGDDSDVRRQLARLLQPTIVMLSSPNFPKDVLNAVGLLVASVLTVRTCDAWLLASVCAAVRDSIAQCAACAPVPAGPDAAAHRERSSLQSRTAPTAAALAHLFAQTDVALRVVAAPHPREAAEANGRAGAAALHDVFASVTPNGGFALLKGILAHTSGPLRGDLSSLGLLLVPLPRAAPELCTAPADELTIAYDIILPAAKQYCHAVQEPETRFMAIQTVDSVVRHVRAVLTSATKAGALLRSNGRPDDEPAPPPPPSSRPASSALRTVGHEEGGSVTELQRHLSALCTSSPKLDEALSYAAQLIMALWDDGTQQMSGALYGTFSEILAVQAVLRAAAAAAAAAPSVAAPGGHHAGAADSLVALDQILHVQAERRAKYHALLGLLSTMPLPDFVAELQRHYGCPNSAADAVAAFSRALLAGASNHKIGNVAGDVFAALAHSAAASSPTSAAMAEVVERGIVEPLARAIAETGYVSVSSNVSDAVSISHMTAHFVAPLVKKEPACMRGLLAAITAGLDTAAWEVAAPERQRVEQGVVEVLERARSVGVDVAPYLTRGSTVLRVLESATHSLHYEVRNTALHLCVLGVRRLQALRPWQLDRVEEYLVLNMHLGGDSTARKSVLEMVKKWVRRLMDTHNSKAQSAAVAPAVAAAATSVQRLLPEETDDASPELGTAAYQAIVMDHCRRLADIFAQNIGTSATAGAGLAVERRVTAMAGYSLLLHGLRTTAGVNVAPALLHLSVVPSLLATLSDGWSQARETAAELLRILCELSPEEVLATATAATASTAADGYGASGGSDDGVAAAVAAKAACAHQDLRRAQTFRNAEGAVLRFLLFTTLTTEAQAAAQERPLDELERLGRLLEDERAAVAGRCVEMGSLRGSAAYAFIQANPLHGSLSLCAGLLSRMASAERRASATTAATSSLLTATCASLLECCCLVLRACASLVGTETVSGGSAAALLDANEVVDCRGHVYDRSRPEAESVMRGVVNNTWLSMRVATSCVGAVLTARPPQEMSYWVVRTAAYELVHALLLTKHNGVMRCVRATLKSLAAALVRSRPAQFHRLPAELLEYLMGPEGVTSGDVARMLRRSQGLPHAILALLEAEDTTVPYSLFPVAMRQLLRVARGNGAEAPASPLDSAAETVRRSQRSNALNVMKFIFENKVFADRVVAYVEEAFSLATDGFHDASWYTRNSSLMLFSAVIHRFVGEHPSSGGSGVNTSLHDVAKRTPRGVAYAYAELTRSDGGLRHTAGEDVNVALFPVLQLLSMLSPDPPHLLTKVSHGEADEAARIADAVMRCADSPSVLVRSASAVALCCLVPIASLRRTIAQTRRGLSLAALPAPCGDLGDGAAASGGLARCGGGGGLNACHGALLQLLQFHAHYVGTQRRHCRQRRSSYATAAVAETVTHAISEVILLCGRSVLVKACAVSATVAASLFALLADLVSYGPRHGLCQGRQDALRGLCVEAMDAYLRSCHGALERGSVMEGLSAVVVFLAAQRDTAPIGRWTAEEQARMTGLLQAEAAALKIRRGEHNLLSWVMTQLLHFSGEAAALTRADVVTALRVLSCDLRCDVSHLALHTLAELFGCAAGPATQSATTPRTTIGCVAWGQLVSHMRFAAAAVRLASEAGAAAPPGEGSAVTGGAVVALTTGDAAATATAAQLYAVILARLTPPSTSITVVEDADRSSSSSSGGVGGGQSVATLASASPWRNSDACSAAIDFVTTYDLYVSGTRIVSPGVARVLSHYCEPEQPLECRLAVVKALQTASPFMAGCATDAALASAASAYPVTAVPLFVVLLRLLVDDTANIREAAAVICSSVTWGLHEAPRDQTSCLLAVVRLLRRLHVTGLLTDARAVRSIEAVAGTESPGPLTIAVARDGGDGDDSASSEGGGDDGEEDDVEEDDGVLFQQEAANMFAEETVLSHLTAYILGGAASATPPRFSVYDRLLA